MFCFFYVLKNSNFNIFKYINFKDNKKSGDLNQIDETGFNLN